LQKEGTSFNPSQIDINDLTFTSKLTKWHVDRLILHICTLALITDNFSVDMYLIREDLRLESRQVSLYFGELGARMGNPTEVERMGKLGGIPKSEASIHKMARLKLPLAFPKTAIRNQKKR
jgi:DNA-directed RNA polymerase I subunit RPA49